MKHVAIVEFGGFLGISGERLVVRNGDVVVAEYPLSHIRSVTIAKRGTSISSDLLLACAVRNIFFQLLDFKGCAVTGLLPLNRHATVNIRRAQFRFLEGPSSAEVAFAFIRGKLHNQSVVLKYFSKYHHQPCLQEGAAAIKRITMRMKEDELPAAGWRGRLLGHEGAAAGIYWAALKDGGMFSDSFQGRVGRGASDSVNSMLNYGYSVLSGHVWQALANAGLELYAGVLHADRPGKPSLVLDMMEEYRPWLVDRVVIKMSRDEKGEQEALSLAARKRLIGEIQYAFAKKLHYHGRKLRLESILQRQCYRLAGTFTGHRKYRPYLFKW